MSLCALPRLTARATRLSNLRNCAAYSSQAAPTLATTKKKVIFSGIQPTGTPHIGNYLGAIRQWVRMQDEPRETTELLYSVVDLHAITVPIEANKLRQSKRETMAALLAAGLDPERCTLFYQSSVPAHSELMWILSCTASVGYLSRMTQWKASCFLDSVVSSKLSLSSTADVQDEKARSALKLGLFSYPVLQAADILIYRATHVPVGDDQRQHLEFARECVTNFNSAYKSKILVHPQSIIPPERRIMSLQSPTQKMSKSHADPKSRILITDSPEAMHKKIMSSLTDSENSVSYDPEKRPGVSNLLDILSAFDGAERSPQELAKSMAGESLKGLKTKTSEAVISALDGMRERYLRVLEEDGGKYVDHVQEKSAEKARQRAAETMHLIKTAVGL
ncbi:hypothetical protein TD95_001602 [Thielaviopsis punctulata]|uniref:Tryptophan--tRNA ligase, mitochondrial n=1 Tax=Thielaviopsis punctulata TaxID=72032 RepID=A0A0F4ZFW6_9PEZI|nr:hypothetical protein TD95_001602 [Thielaviopsis punctulata]